MVGDSPGELSSYQTQRPKWIQLQRQFLKSCLPKSYEFEANETGPTPLHSALNKEDWHIAAGGAGVDPKGFSVTTKREVAEAWAQIRAADWSGQAVVLEADGSALPLREGSLDDLVDPDELFIRPRDFSAVGPGLFTPAQ